MARAWVFQDPRQQEKLGEDKCPWSVGWIDLAGKRKSRCIGSKSRAEKHARKIEGQLAAGTYEDVSRKKWNEFRTEYESKIASGMRLGTRRETLTAADHFERITRPGRLASITTDTIDRYISIRRQEKSKRRKGLPVSSATVNKELRHLKSMFRVAHEWNWLPKLPKVRMLREQKHLPRYVTAEHFAAIYEACDVATLPRDVPYPAATWWRALLMFLYMTGWRIGEPLALRREDVDLDAGNAVTRAPDNKGGRDDLTPLHAVVVDHLRGLSSFDPMVFPWPHDRRTLDTEFHKIQKAASIHLTCRDEGAPDHEHTDACHRYGFHDLRRAFATANAETLTPDALQALMRHKSYTTTQRYINISRQLNRAVAGLQVPPVRRKAN